MLKRALGLILTAVMLLGIFGLTACNGNKIVEIDYFRVELNKKDGYAIILELTELGKEQEILAVPMFVESLPVRQIGGNRKIWYEGDSIRSENLAKLYLPHTVEDTISRMETASNSEVVVNRIELKDGFLSNFHNSIYDINIIYLEDNILGLTPQQPNVFFMYNYSDAPNEGYFWIDYVTASNLFMLPPSPFRENYNFAGWYLDTAYSTLWNEQMPQSAEETLTLYAKWQKK